ncbi:MAG: hypothetical protein HY235_02865 [Acidobacteria bacterium]|nr:hypothetical protein [Acidobacteriota bacterium]
MSRASPRRDWTLSESAFNGLLAWLSPDREAAGRHYEQVRRKLTKLFQWRGCPDPDEYTDQTMDRVARRVAEGHVQHIEDPWVYFHAVALNVLREHWRNPQRKIQPLDDTPACAVPALDPAESEAREADKRSAEARLVCLERCMERLPPETRRLVVQYHAERGADKIRRRVSLAEALGIPLNALRIRLHRVRLTLAQCVETCLSQPPDETN